jgi:hypothetical protein
LKQLHSRVIGNDSNFCDCTTEFTTVVIVPSPDGGKMTLDGKPYIEPAEDESPKICEVCGKPNREPLNITFNINPSVELTGEA